VKERESIQYAELVIIDRFAEENIIAGKTLYLLCSYQQFGGQLNGTCWAASSHVFGAGHLNFSEGNREVKGMKIGELGCRDEKKIKDRN
jgi:hypothetical protein